MLNKGALILRTTETPVFPDYIRLSQIKENEYVVAQWNKCELIVDSLGEELFPYKYDNMKPNELYKVVWPEIPSIQSILVHFLKYHGKDQPNMNELIPQIAYQIPTLTWCYEYLSKHGDDSGLYFKRF